MNKHVYNVLKFLPDSVYLRIVYGYHMHKWLNLRNPKTFNEKLQWLKLNDRKDIYTTMVDKVAAKEFVSEIIGEEYIIPNIGVWDNIDDIDYNILPKKFVIKCTHNSGKGMCICKNKNILDFEKMKIDLKEGQKEDYYLYLREWPYKNVPRRIIAEQFLENEVDESLNDYKVLCFDGKAKLIELHQGRFTDHQTQDFYDTEWNKLPISQSKCAGFGMSKASYPKPVLLEKMLELSEVLSKDTKHLRVDWYIVNNNLYFSELTFFDGSGLDPFDDAKYDYILGSWINL